MSYIETKTDFKILKMLLYLSLLICYKPHCSPRISLQPHPFVSFEKNPTNIQYLYIFNGDNFTVCTSLVSWFLRKIYRISCRNDGNLNPAFICMQMILATKIELYHKLNKYNLFGNVYNIHFTSKMKFEILVYGPTSPQNQIFEFPLSFM